MDEDDPEPFRRQQQDPLYCSFLREKASTEVRKLIAGPSVISLR
jgi:hypothetical protein